MHVQRKLHVFPHFACSASLRLPDVLSGLRQGPHMSLGPCVSESLRGHQMLWNTHVHLGDSSVDMWSKVTISRVGPFTLIWRLDTQTCPWLSEEFGALLIVLQRLSQNTFSYIFWLKVSLAKSCRWVPHTKHCSLGWPRDCQVHLAQGLIESPWYGETRSHKRALQRDSSMFKDSKWNGSPYLVQ